ncbi:MAG: VPLPA-CTERM sorting domain-containing protein [Calditrichaceae bacterium]
MKKFLTSVVLTGILIAFSIPASASLTTPWVITDGQSTQFSITFGSPIPNLEFGIYDLNDSTDFFTLLNSAQTEAELFYDGSTNISITRGVSAGNTLDVDGSGVFGFYFSVDGGSNFIDYAYTRLAENQWQFSPDDYQNLIVINSDVAPVPIPGAALLLSTGLVGLIGLRRRMNEVK